MKQTILIFGGISMLLMLLFQLSKYSLFYQKVSTDSYVAIFGLFFLVLGYGLSRFFAKPKEIVSSVEASNSGDSSHNIDKIQLEKTGLSNREYEILLLIAQGLSNAGIAKKLFISENTVKTHVSKILTKLEAKRRTQAVQIARALKII